jgi:hypothetical protein
LLVFLLFFFFSFFFFSLSFSHHYLFSSFIPSSLLLQPLVGFPTSVGLSTSQSATVGIERVFPISGDPQTKFLSTGMVLHLVTEN